MSFIESSFITRRYKMNIYPYGENGITNSLVEAFDQDKKFFSYCIKDLTNWTDNSEREFQREDIHPTWIIQQPGFGRRGFGEPDGLIKANRYAFYLETKAISYWNTFAADWKNFIKMNKYFSIASRIKRMENDEHILENKVIEMDEDGGLCIGTRRFIIGDRPEIIQQCYRQLRKKEFYIIILTKDRAGDWPEISEHYRHQVEAYSQLIQHEDHFPYRFGWMPLLDVYDYTIDREENYYIKLRRAFQCNGF